MSTMIKATSNSSIRGNAMVVIAIYSLFAVFSIVMAIYDISTDRLLFGILFAVAAFLFITLLLLKANSVFGTYLKVKDGTLYMKSWVGDFLPYNANGSFIDELKPSKTKITEIPIDEISVAFVGSKDFIKRNATVAGKRLARALYPYEHTSNKSKKNLVSSLDLFYIETIDGECSFMCVHGYDPADVVEVIGSMYEYNPDLYVKVNSRDYKRHVRKLQQELEY